MEAKTKLNMFSRLELRLSLKKNVGVNLLLSLLIDRPGNTRFRRSVAIFPKWRTKTAGNLS